VTRLPTQLKQALSAFDFEKLFIEELGWDRYRGTLAVEVDGVEFVLQPAANKRGLVAFVCSPNSDGSIPSSAVRRKIERRVAKSIHEHLIVFVDTNQTTQVWQWVKREKNKPLVCRDHTYSVTSSGDALVQKLEALAFTLDEEEDTTILDATRKTRKSFDVETVTKKFYDRFQKEHKAFLAFIEGIDEVADREWYASVMLNRLMFCYFIQKKGFLDGDTDYLRNRLDRVRAERGEDQFHSFYRQFLLRLFHEGLGGRDHKDELEKLLGRIPYLNGGLFDIHELERPERYGEAIQIPDEAFKGIFNYFDQYQWHLDDRPLREQNEINPDVLGYIFEKYINQKQMGAYYSKEDITEYISKNTVLPYLFDAAKSRCKIAFENPDGPTIWDLLQENPDRYIYEAVRHGVDKPLPKEIAVGVNPPTLHDLVGEGPVKTLQARKEWNKPAPNEFALPTEIWREVVARRQRYEDGRAKIAAGEVQEINDLITLNLDIRQFAQDVVETCEGPDLLRAFWHAIESVTILDPTCGSGAFLFAALNILEPLYEACLDRMEAFVEDLERSGEKHRPEKFSDFRTVLERVAAHPNRKYFVYKSIILNNLYGVDIMDEAIEICKLRLFLKLAAQVEPDLSHANLGIEPLPDIDFNIRAGNTLVGYATLGDVRKALSRKLDLHNNVEKVETAAADLQQAFDAFRARQIAGDGTVPAEDKKELRRRLDVLSNRLDNMLSAEHGIDTSDPIQVERWKKTHCPFHWFIEFHGIIRAGGFDAVIGNPPYVELSKVQEYNVKGFSTADSGNLYPLCVERSTELAGPQGHVGLIVPLSGFSTKRMRTYQSYVRERLASPHISFYSGDAHPSVLFEGVKYRLCIILGGKQQAGEQGPVVSDYIRWYASERGFLFESKLVYENGPGFDVGFLKFGKLGTPLSRCVIRKLLKAGRPLGGNLRKSGRGHITYHRSPVFWIRSMDFEPFFRSAKKQRSTDHIRDLYCETPARAQIIGAVLNSTLFYFWFTVHGNCRNIAGNDVELFPFGDVSDPLLQDLPALFSELMTDLKKHSRRRVYVYKAAGKVEYDEFYPSESKDILDRMDQVFARHLGMTEEELDFVVSYDIKYRMGRNLKGDYD